MKRVAVLASAAVLAVVLLASCGNGETAAADDEQPTGEQYEWIVQSCFETGTPLTDRVIGLWAEKVEEMSGGQLSITLHGAGEIVPGEEVFEAVREGALDAGQNTPAWQKGEFPAGDLFYTLPGGITEFHDLFVWEYGYGGKELEQEMYGDQVVVFPLGLTPPEQFWTNKEINTVEDFEGLKFRSAGLSMELWEALGGEPVLLSGGEVVPSLQRGVIDGAEFAFPSMDVALGLPDVSSHVYNPPIHMGSNKFQLVVNPEKWDELPDHLKAIVENAATAATFEGYAEEWIATMESFEDMQQMEDLTIDKLSDEVQQHAIDQSFEILEEKSDEDEFFEKVWESQKSFLREYRPFYEFSSFDVVPEELD